MAMKYNLSAMDILKIFGEQSSSIQSELEGFEKENSVKIPTVLQDFLSLAAANPLMSTADVWTETPCFYSKMFEGEEEVLEELKEHLLIGSDCGAGVVVFGIRLEDLGMENPPVYMQHEVNEPNDWDCLFDSISEYLMTMVCDVISCVEYDTARRVLNEWGWSFKEYRDENVILQQIQELGIDLENAPKYKSIYGMNASVCCGYDEEKNQFFIVRKDEDELEMCVVKKG